jgi:hypothetical protein
MLAVVLTTTIDTRELKFLIRQIDQYSQATEFMIRKTPKFGPGRMALARRLRDDADSYQTDRTGGARRRG